MAFGDVTSSTSEEASATTTHTITLPTLKNNDLLLVFFAVTGNYTDLATTPSGWTKENQHVLSTFGRNMYIFSRRANGGEGSTLEITTSTSIASVHAAIAVEKAKVDELAIDDTDNDATMTPSGFSAPSPMTDYVSVSYNAYGSTRTVSAWDANYTEVRQDNNQSGNNLCVSVTQVLSTKPTPTTTLDGAANWLAASVSLIEDTSDPPAEPAPNVKTMLFPYRRCVLGKITKLTACTARVDWCVPEADATPEITYGATTDTLSGNSGSETYYDEYDFTIDAEVCGEALSEELSVPDCGGEGADYEFVTTGGTQNSADIPGQFCGGVSGTWSLSRTLAPVAPTTGDTYAFSFNYNASCDGGFLGTTEDLGRWQLTTVESHSVVGETYRCVTVWDVELEATLSGWMLNFSLVSNTESGTKCRPGDVGACPPALALSPRPANQWNAYGWTQTATSRPCPTGP